MKGFVRTVHPNGKIDLRLDASGYKRVAPLRDQIVQALKGNGGRLAFDDDSSPEAIRQKFGVSKKAFKQALGKLYKERRIRFQNPGIELLDNSSWVKERMMRRENELPPSMSEKIEPSAWPVFGGFVGLGGGPPSPTCIIHNRFWKRLPGNSVFPPARPARLSLSPNLAMP